MHKIKLENVSRKYLIGKNKEFYAVDGVSLDFPDTGLISIIGKSGSGKSTILNMIGGIDKPTNGRVIIDGQDTTKFKQPDWCKLYKTKIGIIFQSYNLLENETVIFNVAIPLMINGYKRSQALNKARMHLDSVGIKEELFNKKASLLSGGEKQRVALARTLVNEPGIVLCDEPTGALDSKNSIRVMDYLKSYAEKHLVILVSHNLQLVNKYSDRIIRISNGKVKNDKLVKNIAKVDKNKPNKCNRKNKIWIELLSMSNYKRRIKRNVFSIVSLSISLISTFLTIGFINGKDASINEASVKQFDFGSGTLSEEEEISKGSILTLTRSVRPSKVKIQNDKFLQQNFDICPNFDAIIPPNPLISYDGEELEGVYYNPVYSFESKSLNSALLFKGYIPKYDSLNEAVINDKCYSFLCSKLGKEIINEYVDISYSTEYSYVDFDGTVVTDIFRYNRSVKITGVVKELNYLQNEKIYYSYAALTSYLSDYILPNLSTYFNYDMTWYDLIANAEDFDPVTSYSCRIFLSDYKKANLLFNEVDLGNNLSLTSSSLLIRTSLLGFVQVAEYGLLLFLIVTIIGSVLIIGIMSFTSYSEDHKISAILSCIGANETEICNIYLNESLFNGFISISLSAMLSLFLSMGINYLISRFVDLKNIIDIPFKSFLGMPYLFPILFLFIGLVICFLTTSIPIVFSKKISLKEELQSI